MPDDEWWIKSDGVDVVSGLTESMRLEWGGDVDLGDGKLLSQHEKYLSRVHMVKGMVRNLNDSDQRSLSISDIVNIKASLDNDLVFIPKGSLVYNVIMCKCHAEQHFFIQFLKRQMINFLRNYHPEKNQVTRRCLAYVGQWMSLDD